MAILDKIKLSGVTYDIIDATAVHSLDGYWNSGQTESAITAATSALAETIGNMHYQTSGDVQNAISGKADTSAVTESINEAVSGKLDTSTFNTYSGSVDTALSGKQETLVNQVNIKSINGASILGSGDLTVDTGLHASVSGTTLIFQ